MFDHHLFAFVRINFPPPKAKWSTEQIPDLTGRVAIVTGGNTGIGKETVKALLEHNAKVYLASRTKAKAEEAIADLKASTGKEAIFLELDLGSLAAVRKSAEEFLSKEKELHILVNNAGVMMSPIDDLTADGYDLQWGTNVIGHFFFTELLMPVLLEGKASSPDGYARVITVSSAAAYLDTIDWESFRDGPRRRRKLSSLLYAQSKFANIVTAREAARRWADKGILSMSVHPGTIRSDLYRYQGAVMRAIMSPFFYSPAQGALTQLWAATAPGMEQHNGEFLIPWARLGKARREAYDAELGSRLWTYLEEQIKDK